MCSETRTKILVFIFLSAIIAAVLYFMTGCSIIEVKQSHYKRDLGNVPERESLSIESIEAAAVGATEVNRGINWIYYQGVDPLNSRVKALLDFSYNVMGFLGVAWDRIDWDNPEEWFNEVKEKQDALDNALKEKASLEKKFQDEFERWQREMALKENAIKSKADELAANDGKWSAKLTWVWSLVKWSVFLVIFIALGWWGYTGAVKMIAGIPFKAAFFGGKAVAKLGKQVVNGIQKARLEIKDQIENGTSPEEKKAMEHALDILHRNLASAGNEEVHELIDAIKEKNKMKRMSNE